MSAAERAAILDAALARAGAEGWTWAVLERAARDAGFDAARARRRFPGGLDEALDALGALFDSRAIALAGDLAGLPVRARIAALVRARLIVMAPHRAAVRRLAALAGSPNRAAGAARSLARTVDTIWRRAGDTATGFDHYTKRGLLAGVYAATLLCWLGDDSAGFAATWAFLDRRIADVMRINKARGRFDRSCAVLDRPLRRLLRAAGRRYA